jgi:hypothetical protein
MTVILQSTLDNQ